ncbi:DUF4287 domain-containing protein [Pseudactinotalea sp. Z1748]|uniref:DUF4287 domain-containing protein n=1 Tax=Pseudactinotalea sp. Z1748 TaxID=3413027 RepID=UPI003C7E9F62
MTKQESFTRRVRERMAKTGEVSGAARRRLSPAAGEPGWVHPPQQSDEQVVERTGRTWNQWREVIDAGPGRDAGHAAIATFLEQNHEIGGWWAQAVTVGYERITGIRAPHQRADGTFEAGVSRTLPLAGTALRAGLLDESGRADLLGGLASTLRSRPTSTAVRLGVDEGVVLFTFDPRPDGQVRVTVTHSNLAGPAAVEHWRAFWGEWLQALHEAADDDGT